MLPHTRSRWLARLQAALLVASPTLSVWSGVTNPAWPHEPGWFTPIENQGWAEWGSWGNLPQNGYMSLVSNQDGPLSAPSAIQFRQPRGMVGGGDPPWGLGQCWLSVPANRYNKEVFVGVWAKVSPNFQGHSSGVQKLWYFMTQRGATGLWLELHGTGGGPLGVQVVTSFAGVAPREIAPNETNHASDPHSGETAAVLSRGVWHRIEVYAMLPPASGGDGTVRVWVDGTLTINRADVPMSFGSQKGWVQLHHDAIWGGVGDTKQHDDYVWLDQTYISGP